MHKASPQAKWLPVFFYLLLAFVLVTGAAPKSVLADTGHPYETIFIDKSGRQMIMAVYPLPPPKTKVTEDAMLALFMAGDEAKILPDVPAFDWSYGCSSTAAAMLFGYYDRIGYKNIYTGPTDNGICPLDNSIWGYTPYHGVTCWECPLSVSHDGIDGRTVRGHVDDYWIDYNSPGPDPWVVNGWTEHTPQDCLGDFMGTNQWKFSNTDASTMFFFQSDGSPTSDSDLQGIEPEYRDGCHGMKLFAESRGYRVEDNYNQMIYGQGSDPTKGFTFENYQAEIDAGHPVFIQLEGHTMLGYGYETTGEIIYVHNTWDYSNHTMTWGGVYSGMQHRAVSVIHLAPPPQPIVTTDNADNITQTSATLHGNLASLGDYSTANVSFVWGIASDNLTYTTDNRTMDLASTFSDRLMGLTSGTTYYFRAKATGSFGTVTANTTANFTTVELSSITVTPDSPSIPLGRSQQFTATGTYSDNATANITSLVTWSSNNTTVATIDTAGLATGLVQGLATITARSDAVSGTTILTVGPKELRSVAITPDNPSIARNHTVQFTATGTYTDNSTADITNSVTWWSDNQTVAEINATGLASGLVEGITTITARSGLVSDDTVLSVIRVLDSITVTPSPTVPAGRTQQFTANGTYSDLLVADLTSSVTWSSGNTTVATIDSSGLATTYIQGTTVISAALGSVSGNTTLIVGDHVLDSVAVTPVDPKVTFISGNPQTLQFSANASYSDGTIDITNVADWTSDNVTVATIDAAGLATILSKGKAIISATYGRETANSTLEVSLPVSTTESGGGGGGGGGPSGVTSLAEYITSDGTFVANATAESMDGKVKLTIPKGTIGRNRAGQRLYSVSIKESQTPPAPPADCHYICLVYDIGPGGATFEPPASLTFQYSDAQVPAGVSEENIKLATWQDGVWVELDGGVVDPLNNTITVPVSHFSTYTVIAYTSPAKLEVSGMTVTPGEVYPGETVTVSAVVANAGDLAGSFTITLEMNGAAVQTEEVALDGHQSQAVNFTVIPDKTGEYTLDINGLSYIFKVKERVSQNKPEELPVPAPASFSVSDFSVTPAEIYPSGQVTVAARIVNIGESDGTYMAVLNIDGLEEAQKEVTVKASTSETLTFVVSRDKPGTYSVVIGSHTAQFKVIEKILPTPPVTMVIMGSEPAPERVRGWTVGFAAGGFLVTAMAFYLTGWWRKRGAREKLS